MSHQEVSQVVEQLTRRKLHFSQKLLKDHGLPFSGDREKVRERVTEAIAKGKVKYSSASALLDELDAWGDQRIRIMRLDTSIVAALSTPQAVKKLADGAGLGDAYNGEIELVPPTRLTPMRIALEKKNAIPYIKLVAAKTREFLEPLDKVPEKTDKANPGVVWKPFRNESQKSVSFAEINIATGETVVSATLLRRGSQYEAEFEEFFELFDKFLPLDRGTSIHLFEANRRIRYDLLQTEVNIFRRRVPTRSGGTIDCRSHSPLVDIRTDPELIRADEAVKGQPCRLCNCYWEPTKVLQERVHTHVHGPEGEVSILGQITEESARYVLRRIISLN